MESSDSLKGPSRKREDLRKNQRILQLVEQLQYSEAWGQLWSKNIDAHILTLQFFYFSVEAAWTTAVMVIKAKYYMTSQLSRMDSISFEFFIKKNYCDVKLFNNQFIVE